ncbi:MAG: oxidoreductase [Candidatus Hodarchaeota archaeon]
MSEEKAKIAFYWAASCGGCEIAILDLDEAVLDVAAKADIVFWPVAVDTKYHDVEVMPDNSIDVTFFNGGIRNSEAVHVAKVLRQKSKYLVAFGTCAHCGGAPALANFKSKDVIFNRVYNTTPSTTNPEGIYPQTSYNTEEGKVTIPEFFEAVYPLDHVVPVDYYLPGCPPPKKWILAGVTAFLTGELPPKGSVIAEEFALCKECPREKPEKHSVKEFKRVWEVMDIDPKKCLLDQGIICLGPATRGGCEARCITTNYPCRGCFGPAPNILDMGAKMISVLGSIIDEKDEARMEQIVEEIPDIAGTLYEFTAGKSVLLRRKK